MYQISKKTTFQAAPIQRKRKLVSANKTVDSPNQKLPDDISSFLFWDTCTQKYYTKMKPVEGGDYRSEQEAEAENPKKSEAANFYTGVSEEPYPYIIPPKTEPIELPETSRKKTQIGLSATLLQYKNSHFVQANVPEPNVYEGGEEVNNVFATRFYAEGNMNHARGLAYGLAYGLPHGLPRILPGEWAPNLLYVADVFDSLYPFPFNCIDQKRILIKATEYRSLNIVNEDYGLINTSDKIKTLTGNDFLPNFQGSFGGATGDMTREPDANKRHRKYDLIQATFFWLQGYNEKKIDICKKMMENLKQAKNAICTPLYKKTPSIREQCSEFLNNLQKKLENLKKLINTPASQDLVNCIMSLIEDYKKTLSNSPEEIKNPTNIEDKGKDLVSSLEDSLSKLYTYFFDEGTKESFRHLMLFIEHKAAKLTPDGVLQIIISNVDPYNGFLQELTALENKFTISCGEFIEISHSGQSLQNLNYPDFLAKLNLNPYNFQQTQTFFNKPAAQKSTEKGDIIIRISPKKAFYLQKRLPY